MIRGPIRRPNGAPDSWICNARVNHTSGSTQCHCLMCLRAKYTGLHVGPPIMCDESFPPDALVLSGYFGLYIEECNSDVDECCEKEEEV